MSAHDQTTLPRFSRKETRQLAQEAVDVGFVYVGDDSKGHAQFFHAESGYNLSLAETPGHGQIKRVRRIIARAAGHAPTKYNAARRKERAAAMRDVIARDSALRQELVKAAEEKRGNELWARRVRHMVENRYAELRKYDLMMRTVPGHRPGRSVF